MKVNIITYNVNQAPRGGGDPSGSWLPPGSPKYFCFYFFCSDVSGFVQVSCIFLHLFNGKVSCN